MMDMMDVLIVKYLIISGMWTLGCIMRFMYIDVDPSAKNMSIALAPWIPIFLYFLFFWWG